jgi:F1F0 ATPase subunit 2
MTSVLLVPLPALLSRLVIGLVAGTAAGAWHFVSLRWNWPLFASGRTAMALALQIARIALTCGFLLVLARVGALALLAGMGGVLLARRIALRHCRCDGRDGRYGDMS